MRVLIINPRLGAFTPRTVKLNAHTSYLYSFLKSKGIEPILRDCNWNAVDTTNALSEAELLNVNAIVVICNNTILYGEMFKSIVDQCKRLRETTQINIWFTGYMATSFYSDFINYEPSAGGICDASGILWMPTDMENGLSIGRLLVEHACFDKNHPGIIYLDEQINFSKGDRLSLLSSKSCNAKCSFCAYNNGQGPRWESRSISHVVRDIKFGVQTLKMDKITFSDNDFFGNRKVATQKIQSLGEKLALEGISFKFSINARAECLSSDALRLAKELGLTNITIGLESLHPETLSRIYFKKVNYKHLDNLIIEAEKLGIHLLLSYILWQPYLTIDQLKYEIQKLIELGRWRVPQLLVNSIVKVVPSTAMERKLIQDGILHNKLFSRSWDFVHSDVKQIYEDLLQWHNERSDPLREAVHQRDVNNMTHHLAETKILELAFLIDRLNMGTHFLQKI